MISNHQQEFDLKVRAMLLEVALIAGRLFIKHQEENFLAYAKYFKQQADKRTK